MTQVHENTGNLLICGYDWFTIILIVHNFTDYHFMDYASKLSASASLRIFCTNMKKPM